MNSWELKILRTSHTLLPVSTTELLWGLQKPRKKNSKSSLHPCTAVNGHDHQGLCSSWGSEVRPADIPMAEPRRHKKPLPVSNILPTAHKSMFCSQPVLQRSHPKRMIWSHLSRSLGASVQPHEINPVNHILLWPWQVCATMTYLSW